MGKNQEKKSGKKTTSFQKDSKFESAAARHNKVHFKQYLRQIEEELLELEGDPEEDLDEE